MGCDIHSFAEVKVKGEWKTVGHVFRTSQTNRKTPPVLFPPYESGDDTWELDEKYSIHPYDDRNYGLFAILAGVRNGWGIKPISEPKGVPEDASKYYKWIVDQWAGDGHDHSWLTYKEIVEWRFDALTLKAKMDHEDWDDAIEDDLTKLMFNLQSLTWAYENVDEARMVFFFDN